MSACSALPKAGTGSARACILIVEDDFLIRLTLSDALRDEGYEVIEACNAEEALVALKVAAPQMIISDVRMPGSLDGLDLLASVRTALPALPVFVMSGHLDASDAMSKGATRFLVKPFSLGTVLQLVRDELGRLS